MSVYCWACEGLGQVLVDDLGGYAACPACEEDADQDDGAGGRAAAT